MEKGGEASVSKGTPGEIGFRSGQEGWGPEQEGWEGLGLGRGKVNNKWDPISAPK